MHERETNASRNDPQPAPTRPGAEKAHPAGRRSHRAVALFTSAILPFTAGCSVLTRLDYTHLFSRAGWQHTDRVVETLEIGVGQTVADLGAGDGYFTFVFADAVGPEGTVYAVEIDEGKLELLRKEVAERGYENIEVVAATPSDARLPNRSIELAFFCNAYHHFDDRVGYMQQLRGALKPDGRVAIIDGRNDSGARLFIPEGHWLETGVLVGELSEAGFALRSEYDFLPTQTFDVFTLARTD